MTRYREQKRRFIAVIVALLIIAGGIVTNQDIWQVEVPRQSSGWVQNSPALEKLNQLEVKGRAPKTGYDREQFGGDWAMREGCDTRNIILYRDLTKAAVGDECKVVSGKLDDPYTGQTVTFARGAATSSEVQIDHVVALSDAWQKGAQQLTYERRVQLANDPLELLAVDGEANQQKSGSDAASWLPPNKAFRCQYVARQIAIKAKYDLWITQAEYAAIKNVLSNCPDQVVPSASD
jgi:hypothetical protein